MIFEFLEVLALCVAGSALGPTLQYLLCRRCK
jgi:hypothetical protein